MRYISFFKYIFFYHIFFLPNISWAVDSSDNYILEILFSIRKILSILWNYVLFTTDNQPVKISSFIVGIIALILGFKLAKYLTSLIKHRLLRIINLEEDVVQALTKITHYTLLMVISFIVLDLAHVPLTIFTFIGGALAVSFGLGFQHMINNFISGIVLMIERPISVGNIIQIDDIIGTVKNIESRCVVIRTQENKDILIPHSTVMQNTIINWTLNDKKVREKILISVIYNEINLSELEEIILSCLNKNSDIISTPSPQILFLSFENNIVNMEVNYWINLGNTQDRRKLSSDLHKSMSESFKLNNISLAIKHIKIHTIP